MKNILTLLLLIPLSVFGQEAKEKGYVNYSSFASLIGSKHDKDTYINTFQMEHNYLFNKNFAFGISTGIEWMNIKTATIGPNVKIIFPGQNIFLGASTGRVIPLEDIKDDYSGNKETVHGKDFINTELGYNIPTSKNIGVYLAVGYRFQEHSYSRKDWWFNEIERSYTYHRFMAKIGFIFW